MQQAQTEKKYYSFTLVVTVKEQMEADLSRSDFEMVTLLLQENTPGKNPKALIK